MFIHENLDKDTFKLLDSPDSLIKRGDRILANGVPNSGKSSLITHLICDTMPEFDQVFIYRDEDTREYDKIPHTFLKNIRDFPNIKDLDLTKKILVVFEDMGKITNKIDLEILDKLLRVWASHFGLCVIIAAQNFFDISPALRRKISIFHIFLKNNDIDLIVQHMSLKRADKKFIIDFVADKTGEHDYITIDISKQEPFKFNGTPIVFAKNIYIKIKKKS